MKLNTIVFPDTAYYPGMQMQLHITKTEAFNSLNYALSAGHRVFTALQKDPNNFTIESEKDLEPYGNIVEIQSIANDGPDFLKISGKSIMRGKINSYKLESGKPIADVDVAMWPNEFEDAVLAEACFRELKGNIERFLKNSKFINPIPFQSQYKKRDVVGIINDAIPQIRIDCRTLYSFLESKSEYEKFVRFNDFIIHEANVYAVKNEIESKVKKILDKNQRDFILREQIKVIKRELGEDEHSEVASFREQLNKLDASDEIKEKIGKEINRYELLPSGSQDASVSRSYIETLFDIPWNTQSEDNMDIVHAREVLEEDHYGLEKIKERILEYLAVRNFKNEEMGSILCLVGPPGTGKTSIAKSVARALNKKYARLSLGGVHDEAEIRGHRRTYIGAMPGRVVYALRNAGVNNPVMLLDEIDKTGSDYKGDISSALLEVLDPEQNSSFSDHYVELPIDLSHVLFITTANTLDSIPKPLLDRMEVIEVSGYTENEKLHIAKDYLVKKQLLANGLTESEISFTNEGLKKIIHNYTRESGVRSLDRTISKICRKAAKHILEGAEEIVVDEDIVSEYLGKELHSFSVVGEKNEIGIVRGLAWTSVGGDTLEIEVNVYDGDGKVTLTGSLGDVMKESATAGITYIRSIASSYGIEEEFFKKHDIHLHIPEGAVPKDGPSAGITMATAVLSAITAKPVLADIAMTGEITLRGRVLPVGGLKEKLLAANLAGVRTVIVPEKNRKDIEELSTEITKGMKIVYASTMSDVLGICFEEEK